MKLFGILFERHLWHSIVDRFSNQFCYYRFESESKVCANVLYDCMYSLCESRTKRGSIIYHLLKCPKIILFFHLISKARCVYTSKATEFIQPCESYCLTPISLLSAWFLYIWFTFLRLSFRFRIIIILFRFAMLFANDTPIQQKRSMVRFLNYQ